MKKTSIDRIPGLVKRLYAIVAELEDAFPGRKFTPDGHLVGSLGEVLAAYFYALELLPASSEGHDAIAADGRRIQIKATQGRTVGLRCQPEHLLVLRLLPNGSFEETYNGPGHLPWDAAGRMQKNGQRAVSLSRLSSLMEDVPVHRRMPARTPHTRSRTTI